MTTLTDINKLVCRLIERKDCESFRHPVPWQELNLWDYLTVIKNPMDLGTCKSKLDQGQYLTVEECIHDVRLIWSNAKKYNLVSGVLFIIRFEHYE